MYVCMYVHTHTEGAVGITTEPKGGGRTRGSFKSVSRSGGQFLVEPNTIPGCKVSVGPEGTPLQAANHLTMVV